MTSIEENAQMLDIISKTYELYISHGTRSSENVNYFHKNIKNILEQILDPAIYKIELEYSIPSTNSTGKKKCDIVVLKNNVPYIIFPVKIIKTNYKQNKNNSWENITGELSHLKWATPSINIIPINIFMNKTPYLKDNKIIQKFENVTIDDIHNYIELKNRGLAYNIINYIIDVTHNVEINEQFIRIPTILGFNSNTQYINIYDIIKDLI